MKNLFWVVLTVCLVSGFKADAQEKTETSKKNTKIIKPQKESGKESKNFVLGGEIRNYTYTEPGFVSHAGYLFGLWGEWNWNSALGHGKTSANVLFGALNYEGQACNLSGTSCAPLSATTNDIISKFGLRFEYIFNPNFRMFYGGGFRYLFDKGAGVKA